MTQVVVTDRSGIASLVEADDHRTLMEAIRDDGNGELLALCGGCCSCATCHVYVDAADFERLPPISEDEDALLDGSGFRTAQSRLSCQIRVTPTLAGLRVTIAPAD